MHHHAPRARVPLEIQRAQGLRDVQMHGACAQAAGAGVDVSRRKGGGRHLGAMWGGRVSAIDGMSEAGDMVGRVV